MAIEFDKQIDLSGEVCPYTFVKSKLALEELKSSQVLEVIVDNAESAANVPRSIQGEGHEIVGLLKKGKGKYHILCRKK